MNAILEIEGTITERGQTTVPSAIRKMLGVEKNGKVVFRGMEDGTVVIAPKEVHEAQEDPALIGFLGLLANDLTARPEAIVPASRDLLERTDALVGEAVVDLDARLPDE